MRIVKQEKYEIGDVVLIREWNDMEREYGLNKLGHIEISDGWRFPIERKLWCGKTAPISSLANNNPFFKRNNEYEYNIAEFDPFFVFTPEMIAGKVVYDESTEDMEHTVQNHKADKAVCAKKAIIDAINNVPVNPNSTKTLAEMKEYLQGFEDMRNAVLDILDRNY